MKNTEAFFTAYKKILFYIVGIMLSAVNSAEIVVAFRLYPAYSFGTILLSDHIKHMLQINIIPVMLLSVAFLCLSCERTGKNKNFISLVAVIAISMLASAAGYIIYTSLPQKHTAISQYQTALLIFAVKSYSLAYTFKALMPKVKEFRYRCFFLLPILIISAYLLYLVFRFNLYRGIVWIFAAPIIEIAVSVLMQMNFKNYTKLSLALIILSMIIYSGFNFYSSVFIIISDVVFSLNFAIFCVCTAYEFKNLLKKQNTYDNI